MSNTGNILTYAESAFDTFEEREFCSVDSLILSWVSYFQFPYDILAPQDWKGIRFVDLLKAETFQNMFGNLWSPESSRELLFALASSPRFREIHICGYTQQFSQEQEKQFSAVTFRLTPELSYVAFRGTDSTFVGWKEDFNMAFQSPVPAQSEAVRYLYTAARYCKGSLISGGHSKGGNLAVFSAVKAEEEIRARIRKVYSHDGPGFPETFLQSPEFLQMEDRIEKTVPQSSLVGMLFENQEDYQIVKSNAFTLWQHDPFTWQVEGNDFNRQERLRGSAQYMDLTLNEWIRQISEKDRERFVDALFSILESTDTISFDELKSRSDRHENVLTMIQAVSEMDPETREFMSQTIHALGLLGVKNFPQFIRRKRNAAAVLAPAD